MHLLPGLFEPGELRGGVAVVIDVLRASTTIVHALAAGARSILPVADAPTAREFAANHPDENVVLGGERGGVRIDGFDLDNSPLAYTEETVGGRTVAFTTTNGTRALLRCLEAERVLIGALVNVSGVVDVLIKDSRPIHLVCAGTDGQITAEDVLGAGAIAAGIREQAGRADWSDDESRVAMDYFMANSNDDAALLEAVRAGRGGRNLSRLGFERDIQIAATRDAFDLVPEFSPASGRIEAS